MGFEIQEVPSAYFCCECGARGVRLYRGYMCTRVELRCTQCTESAESRAIDSMSPANIGWSVAAIPVGPSCNAWWGCLAIPQGGMAWWMALPLSQVKASTE